MSALLRIGRALARTGRHLLYADRASCCCEPCPSFYRALPCANPGNCAPIVCDVYVCTDNPCTQPGAVFLYQGWCYKVQPGPVDPGVIPVGAAVLTRDSFGALGPAFCLPTGAGCDHPSCQCLPGPWLYFQACPCPTGAGDGLCRVIRQDQYAILAGAVGSSCVAAPFGAGGCQWVGPNSPRAETLPPGCIVVVAADIQSIATDSCCDCCDGCAFTRITNDECAFVRQINPGWSCTSQTCCCQRTRFEWSLFAFFQSSDPLFGSQTAEFSGSAGVDLVQDPFGIIVPVEILITPSTSPAHTVLSNMSLVCGAHNVIPAGIGTYYRGLYRPAVPGGSISPSGWPMLTEQTGTYGCRSYTVTYRHEVFVSAPGFRSEIVNLVWTITATPSGGSQQTCSRGCGSWTVAQSNPCRKFADIGDGEPVGTGAFL